jgi:hypothetical protein
MTSAVDSDSTVTYAYDNPEAKGATLLDKDGPFMTESLCSDFFMKREVDGASTEDKTRWGFLPYFCAGKTREKAFSEE